MTTIFQPDVPILITLLAIIALSIIYREQLPVNSLLLIVFAVASYPIFYPVMESYCAVYLCGMALIAFSTVKPQVFYRVGYVATGGDYGTENTLAWG